MVLWQLRCRVSLWVDNGVCWEGCLYRWDWRKSRSSHWIRKGVAQAYQERRPYLDAEKARQTYFAKIASWIKQKGRVDSRENPPFQVMPR